MEKPVPVVGGEWSGEQDVFASWDGSKEGLEGAALVIAFYDTYGYEGGAEALFIRDGEWFQVSDSHCSCNGLSNWEPTQSTAEALLMQKAFSSEEYKAAILAAEEWRKLQPQTGA